MKLYATITSERATKGQGGNHLHIKITDKNKDELWRLYVEDKGEKTHISLWEMNQCMYAGNSIKGKRQKGEKCEVCGEPLLDNQSISGNRHSACI
jgi:hypothetical protein